MFHLPFICIGQVQYNILWFEYSEENATFVVFFIFMQKSFSYVELKIYLNTAYFAEIENLLLKVL